MAPGAAEGRGRAGGTVRRPSPDRRGGPNHAAPGGDGLGPDRRAVGVGQGAGAHAAGPGAAAEAARLRALARFTKLLAGAASTADVVGTAAAEAHRELGAAAVSVSCGSARPGCCGCW